VLIRDESRLEEVAGYVHLNPVPIPGLGLSKGDQRPARVLGEAWDASALIRKAAKNPDAARGVGVSASRRIRSHWGEIVTASESIRWRQREEMCSGHGNWGRDGAVAVATCQVVWRLSEAPGIGGFRLANQG
jgi:hypothetical protein